MRPFEDIYCRFAAKDYSTITIEEVIRAIKLEQSALEVRLHPLGFHHVELTHLAKAPAGERLRFHFWLDDTGSTDTLGDLHEHTWHLTSLVLAGGVVDSNLQATPADDGSFNGSRIVYGRENTSVTVGRFNLHETLNRRVEAGSVYKIPSRTVHLNATASIPTATLVRSIEDTLEDGPLVFSPVGVAAGDATGSRPLVDAAEALARLEDALRAVD